MGSVHGFMTTRSPTGSTKQPSSVVLSTNKDLPSDVSLLHMAFQACVGIPFTKQLCIDRSVGTMANGAPFTNGFVLKHKRTLLSFVTANTRCVRIQSQSVIGKCIALVDVVTIRTVKEVVA